MTAPYFADMIEIKRTLCQVVSGSIQVPLKS